MLSCLCTSRIFKVMPSARRRAVQMPKAARITEKGSLRAALPEAVPSPYCRETAYPSARKTGA